MHRDRVVDAGPDAALPEQLHELVAAVHPDGVLVVDVGHPGADRARRDHAAQLGVVAPGDLAAARVVGRQLGELGKADAGVDIGHPEVVADDLVVIADPHPVLAREPDAVGQFRVGGGHHPALAGGHVLGRVEAEAAGSPGAGPALADRRPVTLRSILHQRQAVPLGDLGDRRHVRRLPVQAHRHDGPGARRDRRLDLPDVDVEARLVHVHEDRPRSREQDAVGAGDEGERDGDHLVPRPHSRGEQGQVQRRRPGARGNRVRHADEVGEALLQLAHPGPLGQRAGAQRAPDQLLLFLAHLRSCNGDHGSETSAACAATDRDCVPDCCRW